MVNSLRNFLGTCVDNITVVNYSVKVTLSVSQEINGVLAHMTSMDETAVDSKLNFEVMIKNMQGILRFMEVL